MSDEIFRNHETLFSSDVAIKLGKVHYIILKADTILDDRTNIRHDPEAIFSQTSLTPLGKEIHGNFVKWFLRKHIDLIGSLKLKIETILPILVELKHLAENFIGSSNAKNYEEFLEELKCVIETKKDEVNSLYSFLNWLQQIDELAPCLLFSHPTWSYSELSSRSFTIKEENNDSLVKLCVEIVMGLCKIIHPLGPYPILANVRSDRECDWTDSVDPEEWGNRPSPITFQTVFHVASRCIIKEFATYFQKIRSSAEYILTEISALTRGDLLTNEIFLNLFIKKALPTHIQENKLWDFKETYGAWHNINPEELKFKLATDIAAFANNRGGLLLVGFSNNRKILGIKDIETKILQTQGILKSYFVSGSELVSFYTLKLFDDRGKPVECLVIIIPQTKDVIDVKKIRGGKEFVCPIRISSGTDYTNHKDVQKSKKGISKDNYYFAKDLADFVYFGIGVT